ncbi:MAG: hypothetical protein ABIV50_02190, partial [Opitutus sp.]
MAQAAALLTGCLFNGASFAQEDAATPAPKDHVLFVGTDLAVKEGNESYPVVGAKKDSLQIEKGRGFSSVRLGQGANIKVSRGVKLSSLSATISDIQTESVDRASARAQLAAMHTSMALIGEALDQDDRRHGVVTYLSAVAINPYAATGAGVSRANLDEIQASASASYIGALPEIERSTSSVSTFLAQKLQTAPVNDEVTLDASELPGLRLPSGSDVIGSAFDSLSPASSSLNANVPSGTGGTAEVELTFNVSSPVPLDRAYIVVVANYASSSK